jgi:hypothetical protein
MPTTTAPAVYVVCAEYGDDDWSDMGRRLCALIMPTTTCQLYRLCALILATWSYRPTCRVPQLFTLCVSYGVAVCECYLRRELRRPRRRRQRWSLDLVFSSTVSANVLHGEQSPASATTPSTTCSERTSTWPVCHGDERFTEVSTTTASSA